MDEEAMQKNLDLTETALAKNPKADIASLLALTQRDGEKSYGKEYVLSFILAPLGIYYFFKLFFVDDAKRQAIICLVLTIIMLLVSIWAIGSIGTMFQSSYSNTNSGYNSSDLQNLGL